MKKISFLLLLFLVMFFSSCDEVNNAKQVSNKFYELRKNGDFEATKDLYDAEFKEVTSVDDMIAMLQVISDQMGEMLEYKNTGFEINTKSGVNYVTLGYKVNYENGSMTDTVVLKGSDGDYKILYYSYYLD